jgi:hypothetical protein
MFSAFCGALYLAIATNSFAQFLPGGGIDTPDPTLPPEGVYLSPDDVHAMYTGANLAIVLTAVQHQPFKDLPPRPVPPPPATPVDELHDFDSDLDVLVTCNPFDVGACGPLPPGVPLPFHLDGRVQTLAFGKGPTETTGTFPTEMIAMSLQGGPGGMIQVRESPTLPSLGQTRITDTGGGMYHIDSFFDVFTELSLDGGATWIPSAASTRVDLVPEPASFGLVAIALMAVAGFRRRG